MGCGAGNGRHWFTRRGSTGHYLPHCWRCGATNPRCPTTVAQPHAAFVPYEPVRWKRCGRTTDDRGYCASHGPSDTFGTRRTTDG